MRLRHIKLLGLSIVLGVSLLAFGCGSKKAKNDEPSGQQAPAAQYTAVGPMQAHELIKERPGIGVIDVRTAKEFKRSHIRNAMNINYYGPNFAQELGQLDRNKDYIVYGKDDLRATDTEMKMRELGFTNVYMIDSGFDGWRKAKLPVAGSGKAAPHKAKAKKAEAAPAATEPAKAE